MLPPGMSLPYLWSILLLYLVPSPPLPSPPLPQMSVGRHCACRLLEYTESGSLESTACPFSVIFVPIPFMLTFTNANPVTDAQICQSKAISATSQGFEWRSVDPSTALKLCLAFYMGPISQSWLWHTCLTFTWFSMLTEKYSAHFVWLCWFLKWIK